MDRQTDMKVEIGIDLDIGRPEATASLMYLNKCFVWPKDEKMNKFCNNENQIISLKNSIFSH